MVNIQEATVRGDNHVFRRDFSSRRSIQDIGGVIIGSTINNGISPTAASSRVTFIGTESLLANRTQMTIALRFKTVANINNATAKTIISTASSSLNNNQMFIQFDANHILNCYIATTIGDFSNSFRITAALTASKEYILHAIYNGSLAAASRGQWYINGAATGTTITNTLPTSIRNSSLALTALNHNGGILQAPDTDFILRSVNIYSTAFSPADVLADYQNSLSSGITP